MAEMELEESRSAHKELALHIEQVYENKKKLSQSLPILQNKLTLIQHNSKQHVRSFLLIHCHLLHCLNIFSFIVVVDQYTRKEAIVAQAKRWQHYLGIEQASNWIEAFKAIFGRITRD